MPHRVLRISCERPEGSEVEVWAPEKVSSNRAGQSTILWSFPFRNRVKNDGFSIARIDGGEICTLSYNIWFVFFSATICLNVWDDDPNSGKVWWLKTTSQILYMNLYIYIYYIYIYLYT